MEHTQLIARLLNELAAARASVAASYQRLWPSEGRGQLDPSAASAGKTLPESDPAAKPDTDPGRDR